MHRRMDEWRVISQKISSLDLYAQSTLLPGETPHGVSPREARLLTLMEALAKMTIMPARRMEDRVPMMRNKGRVREGADAFAFRANGDWMERKPVVVLYADQTETVLANDGTLPAGSFVARSAGAAINRAIRSQEPAGGHGHDHGHDH